MDLERSLPPDHAAWSPSAPAIFLGSKGDRRRSTRRRRHESLRARTVSARRPEFPTPSPLPLYSVPATILLVPDLLPPKRASSPRNSRRSRPLD
jgi:hypothetical protein